MAVERTLILIKPDAVRRRLAGEILERIERRGFSVVAGKLVTVSRDLGEERIKEVSRLLRDSINYSLTHRDDALQYAMQFARDMDPGLADRFVAMWVNELTLDYTYRGR